MTKKLPPLKRTRIRSASLQNGKALHTRLRKRKSFQDFLQSCTCSPPCKPDSRSLQQGIVEDLTEVVSRIRADGTFIFANELYCRFFGKEKEELIGRQWQPLAVAEDIPHIQAKLKSLSPSNPVVTIENRVYGGDGKIYWMQFVNRAFFSDQGDIVEIQSVGRDITDRKQVEIALAQNQVRMELALAATNDGLWDWDLRTGLAYLSPRYWELTEYDPEGTKPDLEFYQRLVHPDDWPQVASTMQLHVLGQVPDSTIEYRMITRSSKTLWILGKGKVVERDAAGKALRMSGTISDITERKQTEIALKASQRRLELALHAATDGIWDWDLGTGVAYLSPRYWEMIEYSPEEVTPNIDFLKRLVHPEDWTEVFSTIQLNIHGVTSDCTTECRMVTKNDAVRWIHIKGKAVERGEDGIALRMAGTASDITERKELEVQLQRSKEYLRALFDSLPHLVWMKDRQGVYLAANQSVAALAGVASPKQIVGKSDYDIFPRKFADLISAEDNDVLSSGTPKTFERNIGLDGRSNWVEIFKTPVKLAGEIVGTVGFSQDINYRRVQQEEDRARRRFLQTKVIERTGQLRRKNEELQGFLYAASHDMAGPLGRINNFCALLNSRYREQLDGDALIFLTLIQENATRLMAVLGDLLKHSAVEDIPLAPVPISLESLVNEIIQELPSEVSCSSAVVHFDIQAPKVIATLKLLREVLKHLIGNALKYLASTSQPTLTIGSRETAQHCQIWVADNGIGFDPRYETKIFEMFRRLHTYQEYPGTGIGLAIVKRAVERMNGEVWAKGSPGQGATFFVELPKA